MDITQSMTVAEIARTEPATIKIFQQHQIDFCCGGKIPLAEACARQGLDADALVVELQSVLQASETAADWNEAPLADLVGHIQRRYHVPLRAELPRLSAMMTRVVQRHGDRLPGTLLPLQEAFEGLHRELIHHMFKEDAVLFPAIVDAENAVTAGRGDAAEFSWIDQPIDVMEAEHESAGAALAAMREITRGYTPPDDACPTFRGLYFGFAELERDMHVHVHLENNILFPRAMQLAAAHAR